MGQYQRALLLLAVAALFALFFWWNQKSGFAVLNWAVRADRSTNPIGFWLIQTMLGALVVLLAVLGLLVFVGVLPN